MSRARSADGSTGYRIATDMSWSLQKTQQLTDEQFSQWHELLEARTGVHLISQQRSMLQTALNIRMRELGICNYDEYFQYLNNGLDAIVEWWKLIDQVMINETRFFRDHDSFGFVRKLLNERLLSEERDVPFDVWSVGCSTGEEPYSLAMLMSDCYEQSNRAPLFGITATDICHEALSIGREAKYRARFTAHLPAGFRERYFIEVDSGFDQISPGLRERVCFTHGNIIDLKYSPIRNMDVIFCHNMLIYFKRWRRKEILRDLAERLKPGGVLIIAVGEIVDWAHSGLTRVSSDSVQAYIRD